jgi:parallel beta-helix repeat protein
MTGMTVRNCYIHNTYWSGIAAAYMTDSFIEHNTFVDCAQIFPSGGAIAPQIGCDRMTLRYNNISGGTDNDGIYAGMSGYFITGDVITDNVINIHINPTNWNNDPKLAGSGIHIYSLGSEIARNTLTWTANGYEVYTGGIELWGSGDNVHDNTVSGFKYGIGSQNGFKSTGHHTITLNHVNSCTYGIYLLQSGSTITGNTLTGCTTSIDDYYGTNTVSGNTIK